MILLEAVREILRPQGYSADTATMEHYPMFEGDLDDADEYELSRTHYQDWRKALQATFLSKGAKFVVKSEQHEGALIFGVTPFPGDIGRIWMLQSRLFVIEAYKAHGRGLPYKMGSVTSAMIDLFLVAPPGLVQLYPTKSDQKHPVGFNKVGSSFSIGPTSIRILCSSGKEMVWRP